MEITHIDLP
uniref:Uncharacterized protein n=1 Tax=Arundo donax TaxID=35708 RepID=A0A0A8YCW1_ARUDO